MKQYSVLLLVFCMLSFFSFTLAQGVNADTIQSLQKGQERIPAPVEAAAPNRDTVHSGEAEIPSDPTQADVKEYRETRQSFAQSNRTFDVLWRTEQTTYEHFIFRYNRVESVFLGLGTEKKYYWDGEKIWNAYGSIGWGFKSHTWRSNIGLARQFVLSSQEGAQMIEAGVEGYTLTDTKDQWIISQNENTASAFLFHEDFRDYFERTGVALHVSYYSKQGSHKRELTLTYQADDYDSLQNKVEWALFGGQKKFRTNPAAVPGRMRSVILNGGISTVTRSTRALEGWCLSGSAEFAKRSWGGEFDFDQYVLDIRRFQRLGRYEYLNLRARFGSSYGTLPQQKFFELGGFGTIEAFPHKSFVGNRMILVNMEFILNGSVMDDLNFWPSWIFKQVSLIFTSDAGWTQAVDPGFSALKGFGGLKLNTMHHNFGFAIGNRTGLYRIGFAWRTDRSAPLHFILRLSRPF